MNTPPINLSKIRKAKARAEKKARGDENATKFGQSKVDKARDKARNAKARRDLDGHKREP
ncbi:DUF4169 family protein [Pseudooceanicola sp.]|uniref:DUF4169 family protein n=1 Tax=Pseudooceanicola sp. TaxID=1914328 RepID=UPI0026361660|nr:DUF4169 family protein [Pseudooceanicola sp.]MDF1855494.1 DUF4169 family protein [Pseudooceanicola sp.]